MSPQKSHFLDGQALSWDIKCSHLAYATFHLCPTHATTTLTYNLRLRAVLICRLRRLLSSTQSALPWLHSLTTQALQIYKYKCRRTQAIPVGVQNSATAQDFARTMVWTGYMPHAHVCNTHPSTKCAWELLGLPPHCQGLVGQQPDP
jgi:hypothetical protein